MPKRGALAGCSAMILALNGLVSQGGEMKKSTTEAQVAVLLKWYHDYMEKGKYEQAHRVAELACELAPNDPETVIALKLARRSQSASTSAMQTEQTLEKILSKLEQIEKRLYVLEAKRRRTSRLEILYREPFGSPDSIYSLRDDSRQ